MSQELISIPTVNIRGKEYSEVKDRVMSFRRQERYKGWRLVTIPTDVNDKTALYRAEIYDIDDRLVATGTAFEKVGSGVNRDSHIENAETSAVGRALGFLGIGIVGGIATADEIKDKVGISEDKVKQIEELITKKGSDKASLLAYFKVSTLSDLDEKSYSVALTMLEKKRTKKVVKNEAN